MEHAEIEKYWCRQLYRNCTGTQHLLLVCEIEINMLISPINPLKKNAYQSNKSPPKIVKSQIWIVK